MASKGYSVYIVWGGGGEFTGSKVIDFGACNIFQVSHTCSLVLHVLNLMQS